MFKTIIKQELKKIITELKAPPEIKFNIEKPVAEKFGDFSTNLALVLAKELRKSPIEIAKSISQLFPNLAFLERVEIEQPGFINFYIKKEALISVTEEILKKGDLFGSCDFGAGKKVILEHTNVNPNKALHVGHIRSTCLGSSVERILKFIGFETEVHYYVDDTGVQVAVTGLGLKELGMKQEENEKFDHFAGRVYSETMKALTQNKELVKKQKEIIKTLDAQTEGELLDFFQDFTVKILKSNLETTALFKTHYDLLVWESEILKAGFMAKTLELMKENSNFYFSTEGKNKGCFVMKDQEGNEKVLLKSTGEATYTGKDVAYHLWKFNLLAKDFKYKKWDKKDSLFSTCEKGEAATNFGKADIVINFIDFRQSFPQEMVRLALQNLGFSDESKNMIHIGYGVISLSPKTARLLGQDTSSAKNQYAMSGRGGLFVLADDLVTLVRKQVWKKHPKSPALDEIALGAIKYTMLSYNPYSDIVFSYEKALDIQGNSGPYLQYAYARCQSILARAEKIGKKPKFNDKYNEIHLNEEEKSLLRFIYLFPQIVKKAGKRNSPNILCNFLFGLSSRFNTFYSKHQVIEKGQNPAISDFRLLLVASTAQVLKNGLTLLGIEAVEKM